MTRLRPIILRKTARTIAGMAAEKTYHAKTAALAKEQGKRVKIIGGRK